MKSKKRINITLDKSVYKLAKEKGIKLSTFINQLLIIALSAEKVGTEGLEPSTSRFQHPALEPFSKTQTLQSGTLPAELRSPGIELKQITSFINVFVQ